MQTPLKRPSAFVGLLFRGFPCGFTGKCLLVKGGQLPSELAALNLFNFECCVCLADRELYLSFNDVVAACLHQRSLSHLASPCLS